MRKRFDFMKEKSPVIIKKHNTRQVSSLSTKELIVKSKKLAIKFNKTHIINDHYDILDDNNITGTTITKANKNKILKIKHNKKSDIVNENSNIDDEIIERELFIYYFYLNKPIILLNIFQSLNKFWFHL